MNKIFKIPSYEEFKAAADDVILNLYNLEGNDPKNVTDDDIKLAKEELKKLILEKNGDFESLISYFETQHYSENKVSYFISNLTKRKNEVLFLTLIHFNSAFGETVLDFDWFMKLVMGTCELKTMKYPLLQLVLLTIRKSGDRKEKKIFDISKDMLDRMITVLEEAVNT